MITQSLSCCIYLLASKILQHSAYSCTLFQSVGRKHCCRIIKTILKDFVSLFDLSRGRGLCKPLFPLSSGAVPEQETCCFQPHQSHSREKWSVKLHLSTWLATDHLFTLCKLLKVKGVININEGTVFPRNSV